MDASPSGRRRTLFLFGLLAILAEIAGGAPLLPREVLSDRLRLVSATAVGQFARVVYEVRRPTG